MILDGKIVAKDVQNSIQQTVLSLKGRKPCLAVILVGHNPASQLYVGKKTYECGVVGILSIRHDFPTTITEQELLHEIQKLNQDPHVDGILVQMPLPSHINPNKIMMAIDPNKDVDGFHPINVGKLLIGEKDGFVPCTPLGIQHLLNYYNISVEAKHVVVVGRSTIVGKPMAALLLNSNATITIAHSLTTDLKALTSLADILICAVGKPMLITADMVKKGAVVVDVGTSQIPDHTKAKGYRITGDVDFQNVKDKCFAITPVPGGVGPLTIAMLLKNTLRSYLLRERL